MFKTLSSSVAVLLLAPSVAFAHVSIATNPAVANTNQVVTFSVGHGCEGSDTYALRLEFPASVTSIRPELSPFGKVTVEKNDADQVTAVIWQKAGADLLPSDFAYYRLSVRVKVPNEPFTRHYVRALQTCKAANGDVTTTDWVGTPDTVVPDGGTAPEPAAELVVIPELKPGWNKVTVPVAVKDLKAFFGNAQIVWKGSAAYSANPTTTELIAGTEGVTALTELQANDEIWVRY